MVELPFGVHYQRCELTTALQMKVFGDKSTLQGLCGLQGRSSGCEISSQVCCGHSHPY